jgi:hypothetical protein
LACSGIGLGESVQSEKIEKSNGIFNCFTALIVYPLR